MKYIVEYSEWDKKSCISYIVGYELNGKNVTYKLVC